MDRLELARALAAKGFYLFPVNPDKTPAISGWQDAATRDEGKLNGWFGRGGHGIGISTSRFREDQALVVIDVDVKKGKRGDISLMKLEMEGLDLPETYEQATPSGGRHLVYAHGAACKQGVDVLGNGLDIRSRGGYIVGYEGCEAEVRPAPAWLVQRLGTAADKPAQSAITLNGIDDVRAEARAVKYLASAPGAVEGEAGDLTTYRVAATLKDLGCSQEQAYLLMAEHWNQKCSPPWSQEELEAKIANAYRYGKEPVGSGAPEAVFSAAAPTTPEAQEVSHPVHGLNKEYAYIKSGAFILQETTDDKGFFVTKHLSPGEMHGWYANVPFQVGKTTKPVSQWWIEWEGRRQYEGVVFAPMQDRGPRWYNLWRGFRVEPKEGHHPALAMWIEHLEQNVCNGDKALARWLTGFFAHAVQRPFEKPLVALVFRGAKGTGKNALVERMGWLLGPHFMVADDDRYLLSNFNAHFEACLFMVLDEASWAGDKRAEGRLKGLITGSHHNIERKNKEPYRVDNLTRIAIIGNEEWIVPASADERRFAVFDVGPGRRQDRTFFHDMRIGLEQGGYPHLLHYLQTFDLSGIDVNAAPATQGLVAQKLAGLDMVPQWWMECLRTNRLVGGEFSDALADRVPGDRVYPAFVKYAKQRNVRSRLPTAAFVKDQLKMLAPSFEYKKNGMAKPGELTYAFFNPGIEKLRRDWETFIGGNVEWEE